MVGWGCLKPCFHVKRQVIQTKNLSNKKKKAGRTQRDCHVGPVLPTARSPQHQTNEKARGEVGRGQQWHRQQRGASSTGARGQGQGRRPVVVGSAAQ